MAPVAAPDGAAATGRLGAWESWEANLRYAGDRPYERLTWLEARDRAFSVFAALRTKEVMLKPSRGRVEAVHTRGCSPARGARRCAGAGAGARGGWGREARGCGRKFRFLATSAPGGNPWGNLEAKGKRWRAWRGAGRQNRGRPRAAAATVHCIGCFEGPSGGQHPPVGPANGNHRRKEQTGAITKFDHLSPSVHPKGPCQRNEPAIDQSPRGAHTHAPPSTITASRASMHRPSPPRRRPILLALEHAMGRAKGRRPAQAGAGAAPDRVAP